MHKPRVHIAQTAKQEQKLIMSPAMQHAFTVLQMPLIQLTEWLENELEQNPVLEVSFPSTAYDISKIRNPETLYSYLAHEVQLHFNDPQEIELALFLAGSLDDKGFLTLSEEEICQYMKVSPSFYQHVIKKFHQIEPIGLGAINVQECLLLQLAAKKGRASLLYQIVDKYFDALIHNRLDVIAKKFQLSKEELKCLIQKELRLLDPFPGRQFDQALSHSIIPDLIFEKEMESWKVEVFGDPLPEFHVNPLYTNLLNKKNLEREELDFIRRHITSGKWLVHALGRRKKTLLALGKFLVKNQKGFLEGIEMAPAPMTQREAAKALNLSESTVTRAILDKYVSCPRGLIPLSRFFSRSLQTSEGIISNQKAKMLVRTLIGNESKKEPFSDEEISQKLRDKGIACARRTISKYRKELSIGTRAARKEWS